MKVRGGPFALSIIDPTVSWQNTPQDNSIQLHGIDTIQLLMDMTRFQLVQAVQAPGVQKNDGSQDARWGSQNILN